MTARQEKVREALNAGLEDGRSRIGWEDPLIAAALAEVEEWEEWRRIMGKRNALTLLTRRAEAAEAATGVMVMAADDLLARTQAAEAEADRLREALDTLAHTAFSENDRAIARAALAPAERVCMVCGEGPVTVSVCDRCCE